MFGELQQLQALLETLSSTEPRYSRCVKPTNLLRPAIFENDNVLQKQRCGGKEDSNIPLYMLVLEIKLPVLFILLLLNLCSCYVFTSRGC
ncbi:hypothetical protein U1Q18_030815 [Sarracenia purpurea var. burkii]